ncbi:MAG: caspase family protein, partial [Prevotella sp.]|nr:caspase family protein [Prevotella sp.]
MKIIVFIAILMPQCAFATSKVHLVAVGIADYPGTANDLTLPAKDAATVKWLYEQNTNAVTAILTNTAATKEAILSSIRSTFQYASTDDIIVFFFSGHGYKGGFVAYDGYLDYDEIRKAMSNSHCKNKMIFADACFSGKMRQGASDVKQEHEKSSVMLFLSSRDNETSIERKDMKNGFFTSCLVDALRGKSDSNRD